MYIFPQLPAAADEPAWIRNSLRIGSCFDVLLHHQAQFCKPAYHALQAEGIDLREEDVYILLQIETQQPWQADMILQETPVAMIQEIFLTLGKAFSMHLFTSSGFLYGLLVFSPAAMLGRRVRDTLKVCGNALHAHWGVRMLVSREETGRAGIFHAANSLRHGMEYFRFFGMEEPVQFLDIRQQTVLGDTSDLAVYQRLAAFCCERIGEETFDPETAAKQVLHVLTNRSACSIEALHSQMRTFSMVFLQLLESRTVLDHSFLSQLNMTKRIMEGDHAQAFLQNMASILLELHIQHKKLCQLVDIVKLQRVCAYVEEHLSSLNLSVTEVAAHFHINRSLLTKQFRACFDVSLSEFIQRERLKRACLLLVSHPDRPVEQISLEAGYGAVCTMYRAFQKYGMQSPAAYRQANLPFTEFNFTEENRPCRGQSSAGNGV